MKRLIVAVFGVLLLVSLIATPALADPGTFVFPHPPPWTGGHRAMVTDPLVSPDGGAAYGYVRFSCQSKQGFEYSVGVHGLVPRSTYTVIAISQATIFIPGVGEIPTTDGAGHEYSLGTIKTGADGSGEINDGLVSLTPGVYNWVTTVKDSSDNVVLQSPAEDTNDFQVFP